MKVSAALDGLLDWLADRLERPRLWLLGGLLVLYLLGTGGRALHKLLWFDELATLYVARLSSIGELRTALANGADANPLPFYVVTRWSNLLLGEGPLALRLPAMLDFLALCLCLFRFVSRSCPPLYAWLALLFPFLTPAYFYAYEARPYGLMMGFCGLSLLCWQSAAGPRRRLALMGLGCSLAAAVCCHFVAVFLLIPLGIGELVRSLKLRRLDMPVWLAMAGVVPPLAVFLPAALEGAKHLWSCVRWNVNPDALLVLRRTYTWMSQAAGVPALAGLALLGALLAAGRIRRPNADSQPATSPPAHEVAAAVALAAAPALIVVLTTLLKSPFVDRYTLNSVAGFALLAGFLAASTLDRRPRTAAVLTVFLLAYVAGFQLAGIRFLFREPERLAPIQALQSAARDHASPIVIEDVLRYLEFVHHAPSDLKSRLVFFHDAAAASRHLGYDPAQCLVTLEPYAPLNVKSYSQFVQSHSRFLLWPSGAHSWVVSKLLEDGKHLRIVTRTRDALLIEVTGEQ